MKDEHDDEIYCTRSYHESGWIWRLLWNLRRSWQWDIKGNLVEDIRHLEVLSNI